MSDPLAPNPRVGVAALRHALTHYKPNKIDPSLKRDLNPGWLLTHLLNTDLLTWGRWDYWYRTMEAGRLLDEPIPHIQFTMEGSPSASGSLRNIERCLDVIGGNGHDSWQGWSTWDTFRFLLDWLLFGFGHSSVPKMPREPTPGASMRLYQTFCIEWLMAWPYDVFGDLMAECRMGKDKGFYPTPHSVVEFMIRMDMGDATPVATLECTDVAANGSETGHAGGVDHRLETVLDPCLGTGRMLLHASNYSLRLYGMDISDMVIRAALCNAYLWAPWMVKPFPFLDAHATLSDSEATRASEAIAAEQPRMVDTEHDTWRYQPIFKRKPKRGAHVPIVGRGVLFDAFDAVERDVAEGEVA